MADDLEKTEEPTSRKIEDARKDGNVPKSMDVTGFVGLFFSIISLLWMTGYFFSGLKDQFLYSYSFFNKPLTANTLHTIIIVTAQNLFLLILPISAILMVAAILGNVMQFGIIFTTKPLQLDLKKIDPIKGLKNLFSLKKLVEGIKITAKVAVAFIVGGAVFLMYIKELPQVELFNLYNQLSWLYKKAMMISAIMLMVFFIFAILDLAITRYNYFKQLKMSKQEIKDEFKTQEGNPEIKAKIRRLQQEMSSNRMLADIPDSDVVITNPTHFAVAIKYDQQKNDIPLVMAKGADLIAQKIKEIAREHNVPIYEDKKLARTLYKQVDIGKPIPKELFGAIAEVLAFVYKTKNKS